MAMFEWFNRICLWHAQNDALFPRLVENFPHPFVFNRYPVGDKAIVVAVITSIAKAIKPHRAGVTAAGHAAPSGYSDRWDAAVHFSIAAPLHEAAQVRDEVTAELVEKLFWRGAIEADYKDFGRGLTEA